MHQQQSPAAGHAQADSGVAVAQLGARLRAQSAVRVAAVQPASQLDQTSESSVARPQLDTRLQQHACAPRVCAHARQAAAGGDAGNEAVRLRRHRQGADGPQFGALADRAEPGAYVTVHAAANVDQLQRAHADARLAPHTQPLLRHPQPVRVYAHQRALDGGVSFALARGGEIEIAVGSGQPGQGVGDEPVVDAQETGKHGGFLREAFHVGGKAAHVADAPDSPARATGADLLSLPSVHSKREVEFQGIENNPEVTWSQAVQANDPVIYVNPRNITRVQAVEKTYDLTAPCLRKLIEVGDWNTIQHNLLDHLSLEAELTASDQS